VTESRIKPVSGRDNRDTVERIVGVVNVGNCIVQRGNLNYKVTVLLFKNALARRLHYGTEAHLSRNSALSNIRSLEFSGVCYRENPWFNTRHSMSKF